MPRVRVRNIVNEQLDIGSLCFRFQYLQVSIRQKLFYTVFKVIKSNCDTVMLACEGEISTNSSFYKRDRCMITASRKR